MRCRNSNSPTQTVLPPSACSSRRYCTGSKVRGAVVVRDVPLDAAGYPCADQADKRGLDDVLTVNEIVVIRLVHRGEDTAADLRQHADLYVFVFQIDHLVGLVALFSGERVVKRIGVHAALGALGRPAEIEHRIRIGRAGQVSGNHDVLLPDRDRRCVGGIKRSRGDERHYAQAYKQKQKKFSFIHGLICQGCI